MTLRLSRYSGRRASAAETGLYARLLLALSLGGALSVSACDEDDGESVTTAPSPVGGDKAGSGSSDKSEGGAGGSAAGKGGAGGSAAGKGGAGGAGGSSAGDDCDPTSQETKVDADITSDTTWECGTYLLQKLVYVTDDATLTIKPGVQVLGDTDQEGTVTALIVTRGAKLDAVGTKAAPIVFGSGNPEGARTPGDWGGVVLLGNATINTGACKDGSGDACSGGYFEGNIDGLDPTDPRSLYGGRDDDWDCGKLVYARIEFAGYQLSVDNELNGLTVGGCGKNTKLSYIQVHRGSDDGLEFFGGTSSIDHAIVSAASDDGLDWDFGWRGNVQYLIVHQANSDGDHVLEGDNLGQNESAEPRAKPVIYNATFLGNPEKQAFLLREGSYGLIHNAIVQGFATAVDLAAAQVDLKNAWPKDLAIEHTVFFDNAAVGDPDDTDDDNGFNEDEAVRAADRNNVFDVDPEFESLDVTKPNYKPGNKALAEDKATPPSGFDAKGTFAGAVDPDGDDWTLGWSTTAVN